MVNNILVCATCAHMLLHACYCYCACFPSEILKFYEMFTKRFNNPLLCAPAMWSTTHTHISWKQLSIFWCSPLCFASMELNYCFAVRLPVWRKSICAHKLFASLLENAEVGSWPYTWKYDTYKLVIYVHTNIRMYMYVSGSPKEAIVHNGCNVSLVAAWTAANI